VRKLLNIIVIILECMGIVFLVLVAGELLRLTVQRVFLNGGKGNMLIVVPVSGHNEDAEYLLRSAAAKIRLIGGKTISKVICLNCGMDEETETVCVRVCDDYPFMYTATLSEIEAFYLES